MTKAEFKEAVALAKLGSKGYGENVDDSIFFGCGLNDFVYPIHVTIKQVAKFVNWQAMQFNGEWNAEELDNCAHIAKKKFQIIG
jgi:hypothetical protein